MLGQIMKSKRYCCSLVFYIKGQWRCPASKFAYSKPSDVEIVKQSKKGTSYD